MINAVQQRVQAWKFLVTNIAKISDPILRNAVLADYKRRALDTWGYCPGDGTVAEPIAPQLTDDEQELLHDVQMVAMFNADVCADKREQIERETVARMRMFVADGGDINQIPDEVRSAEIDALYWRCLHEYGEDLCDRLDELMGATPKPLDTILPGVMHDMAERRGDA